MKLQVVTSAKSQRLRPLPSLPLLEEETLQLGTSPVEFFLLPIFGFPLVAQS